MAAIMKQAAGTEEVHTEFEAEFFCEIAKETLEEAYFAFESLDTRQFLHKIIETYAQARLQETNTLAISVLMSTRALVRWEIKPEIRSAVAEKEHLE